ncbi:hypothetical protein HDU93_001146 [Gonapodya sp. JEL0774]|nr:hypothetical protein HDU93_001146 [Gonapodya sp. JEL0774]
MAESPNFRLIEGVETGRLDIVEAALRDGGSPNCTKRVSLVIRMVEDERELKKTDTQNCEVAIVLAIRSARVDIVRALVEAGCDINRPVSWLIPGSWEMWTQAKWERERWKFPAGGTSPFVNALDFAMVAGGPLKFNFNGPSVVINHPKSSSEACQSFSLQPSLDIVRLLLQHGAQVSTKTLELAHNLSHGRDAFGKEMEPTPSFLHLLEEHIQHSQRPSKSPNSTRPPSLLRSSSLPAYSEFSVAKLASSLAEQQRFNKEQHAANTQQRQQITELVQHIGELQRHCEALQKKLDAQVLYRQLEFIKELVEKTTSLDAELRKRTDRVSELEAENHAITTRMVELERKLEEASAREKFLPSRSDVMLSTQSTLADSRPELSVKSQNDSSTARSPASAAPEISRTGPSDIPRRNSIRSNGASPRVVRRTPMRRQDSLGGVMPIDIPAIRVETSPTKSNSIHGDVQCSYGRDSPGEDTGMREELSATPKSPAHRPPDTPSSILASPTEVTAFSLAESSTHDTVSALSVPLHPQNHPSQPGVTELHPSSSLVRSASIGHNKRAPRPRIPRIRRERTVDSTTSNNTSKTPDERRTTEECECNEEWAIAFAMTYGFFPFASPGQSPGPPFHPHFELPSEVHVRRSSTPIIRPRSSVSHAPPTPPPSEPPTPERLATGTSGELFG